MATLRVGVLMGGKSIEREVSFNSGRTVCDHLDTSRYDVIPLFQMQNGKLFILPWHFLHRGKTSDFEHRLAREAQALTWDELPSLIDFMYIAMPGRYAEDGPLQGILELLDIPYLGSSRLASALCMDKQMTKTFLRLYGIDVPRGIIITPNHITDRAQSHHYAQTLITEQNLTLPLIIKPNCEGSSLGIAVLRSFDGLADALHAACNITPHTKQAVIIEEKIEGMEFSCIVLTDYKKHEFLPLPPTEIAIEPGAEIFDYEQKYMPGRASKFTPPRCAPKTIKKIQDTCIRTMQALDVQTFVRIDGFVSKDNRVIIVDVNTLSGMAPSSFLFREAAEINMSHTDLINHLIETDLDRYGMLDAIEKAEQQERTTSMQKKTRIAVLMGGPSNEREISLESGRNVTYKLSPHSYDITPVFVSQDMQLYTLTQSLLVRSSTKEIATLVTPEQKITWNSLPERFDFVFIALHGGPGENGSVQGMLEMLDVPYNGSSVLASALCMDKYKTTELLGASGFEVPHHMLVEKSAWSINHEKITDDIKRKIDFPCIIKPHDDGCSVMVHKASNQQELTTAIEDIFTHGKSIALVEEFITGKELTVGVVGNEIPRALPPSQAIAHKGILSIEEKFLPGAGENQTPAPLPSATLEYIQRVMEHVYITVGCRGYARIDCFYQAAHESKTGKDRVVILEINTLPGLTPATCIFHQAAEVGIKPMDFIDMIVKLGVEAHAPQAVPAHEIEKTVREPAKN